MSDKRIVFLTTARARETALQYVREAPDGYVVTTQPAARTLEQNAKMWAMLADIARQVEWYGKRMDSEDWKHVFSASLRKLSVVPNLDGTGFVALGLSTKRMSKRQIADLIELMYAFGAEKGVEWTEPVAAEPV